MFEKEEKEWRRREIRTLLLRCAWGILVVTGVNFFLFDNKNPQFVFIGGAWLCVVYLLESLHRTWRHRRHGTHRSSGAKGDQPNGEEDV